MSLIVFRRPKLSDSLFLIRKLARVFKSSHTPVIPVVVFERIWFFTVDSVVTNLAHFVGHAEGYAADIFDEHHDQGGDDNVPADDEKGADDLETNLAAVAGDSSTRVGDAEGGAAFLCCPETCDVHISRWITSLRTLKNVRRAEDLALGKLLTCTDASNNSADKMRVEDFERVVYLAHDLRASDDVHRDPRHGA